MKLRQILALALLGFILTSPAFAGDSQKDEKESPKTQNKDKPKPYGCFKDLKWRMSFDEAQKSLGIKLKKSLTVKGLTPATGEVKIGDKTYFIVLSFDSSGLMKVQIDPKVMYSGGGFNIMCDPQCMQRKEATSFVEAYNIFKPSLTDKFGKPVKEVAEDRGSDVDIINNLVERKASLLSIWETDESVITLRVENKIHDTFLGSDIFWEHLLIYEKKIAKEEKKLEL